MPTVREFCTQSYRLISASNPTTPLHGDDLSLMITVMNQLLQSYAATGLMLTIAKDATTTVTIGQKEITVGAANIVPTPNITLGRLANLDSAWLLLNGVTYPLIDESRNEFFAAFKYEPLQGLPRFLIVLPDTDVVRLRLYPAPSQSYEFYMRAKFQLDGLTSNSDMNLVPQYYHRFLLFAVARDTAMYKGRSAAWDEKLEMLYKIAKDEMEAASEVNLAITGDRASMLNGAYRVAAGI